MSERGDRTADGGRVRAMGWPSSWLAALLAVVTFAAVSGCNRRGVDLQAIRREVLAADPEFGEHLERRDELANRVQVLQRELSVKQSQVDRQISQLRDGLRHTTDEVNHNVQSLRGQMSPVTARIDAEMSRGGEELKALRLQRATVGRTMSQLRKSLKAPAELTETERVRMDRELGEILEETNRLDLEIAAVNQHIRLLRNKRLLLRI